MRIKWFILLGLILSLVAASAVSFALPITVDRIRIWQEGDEVFFALQVPNLPDEIEINKKATRDKATENSFSIYFYDDENLYYCVAQNNKQPDSEPETVPISSLSQLLFLVEDARSSSLVDWISCQLEEEEIVWIVELPVIDRYGFVAGEGNEVDIHFDAITHVGFQIFSVVDGFGQAERRNYEINPDGTLTDLGDDHMTQIIYPN